MPNIISAKKLRRLLLSVEWVQPMYNGSPSCPFCLNQQHMGHDKDCVILRVKTTKDE